MESTLVHIVFFLKNGEKNLKENLKPLDLSHNIMHTKKLYNFKYAKF